jgi:predicted O-methyltransferase YrrM
MAQPASPYQASLNDFYSSPLKKGEDGSEHFINRSSLSRDEVEALAAIVEKYKPEKTLEVGLALAASCAAIIMAKRSAGLKERHIALDPFQDNLTKNAGLLELKRLGLLGDLDYRREFSETFLTNAYTANQKFDFIFIDGSHTIGQAVTDAFLSDKVLNPGGLIAIHDAILFSTSASVKYLLWEKGYELVLPAKYSYKVIGRMVKYLLKLGRWYCWHAIPRIQRSVIVLRKK